MDAATFLWGLIGLFVILPVVTLLFFLLARDSLVSNSEKSLPEAEVNRGETNEQTEYVPLIYWQELKQQLKIALKFGLVVQLGLALTIIFLSITGFMSDLLDGIFAPVVTLIVYPLMIRRNNKRIDVEHESGSGPTA